MKTTEIQFTYACATGREAGVAQQARPHDERLSAETALLCSHSMWLPSFLPQQMVRPRSSVRHDVLMRRDRSSEPLASIWVQPCSVLVDPKEKCGFKIQVSPPFSSLSFKTFLLSAAFRCKLLKARERKFLTSRSSCCNARARRSATTGCV